MNQPDLNKRYCISKAIQKNITKLIDVLPYQTCKLQDLLLQSESCLTENENDLIKKQPTRRDQIRQLIRFVKGRSFKAISKFLQYSREYSPEVIDLIWQMYEQLMREGVRETRCVYCRMTSAVDIKDLADYAYEKEVLSDELHQQITDCRHGVGAQTKLWHQLSVLSCKAGYNKILLDSILTYICSTPKYEQYGEELKVLVKRNFRLECKCKDYKRSQIHACNRVESFASSVFSSSVSSFSPRQSFCSLSSNSSGSQKRKSGNPRVKDIYFKPKRPLTRQVRKDENENTSPKYIPSSEDEITYGESAAQSSVLGTNCEETNPKLISFHSTEEYESGVHDLKYISQLSPISSKDDSVESQETKKDTDDTTLKVVQITGNSTVACGEMSRQSATRKTWPIKHGSVCNNIDINPFEDSSSLVVDFCEEDDDKEPLDHSRSNDDDCLYSNTLPRLSLILNQDTESLTNQGSTQQAALPSDRHEALPIFLQDVLEHTERNYGTEDNVCYGKLKRTNSTPTSLISSSQIDLEKKNTTLSSSLKSAEVKRIYYSSNNIKQINETERGNFSEENETTEAYFLNSNQTVGESRSYEHSIGESDVKFNRNFSMHTSADKDNAPSSTFSDTKITNYCTSGEFTNLEMQNATRHRTCTVHSNNATASEPDIFVSGRDSSSTIHRITSKSLSDTSRDATKDRKSLGLKVRDSVRKQRTINNQYHNSKTTKKC